MKGKIESKSHELMVEWATQDADTLAEAYEEQAKKAAEDPALTFIKDVDPSGLAVAIDGSDGQKKDSANKQAANWMSVFSVFDPTGIMGAIGGIIKHNHCESTQKTMDDIENAKMMVPELQKDCGDEIIARSGKHGFLMGTWKMTTRTRSGAPVWSLSNVPERFLYKCSGNGRWVFGPSDARCSVWMESKESGMNCPHMVTWRSYVHPNWVEDPGVELEEQ